MIRKTALLIVFTAIMLIVITGCNGKDNSEIVGRWTPSTATINGQTVQYGELELDSGTFEFTFDSDGKCKANLAGIDGNGTYTFNGTSVDVVTDHNEYKLDYDNGTLTLVLNYDNVTTSFTFTKVREE